MVPIFLFVDSSKKHGNTHYTETTPRLHQDYIETTPRLHREYTKTTSILHRDYTGT